ncbi:MAG: universal stress protein [Chthonomonadales bacterium]|nr:universal stress protein [Chthonomonadales bacterium]
MYSKILLASDGSETALRAAATAAELARRFDASLTVLHVFAIPLTPVSLAATPGAEVDPLLLERMAGEVQDAVARRTGRVLEEAGVPYATRQEIGHPAETIVRVAQQEGFDLVVLGSRGLSEIRSFLLGSVSDKVSHHAPCPVLIVK